VAPATKPAYVPQGLDVRRGHHRPRSATRDPSPVDAAGERVLDAGTQVDSHSLAISGRRIYWMSGGAPRSELLSE
jgi:hypothetical protein